MVVIYDHKWLCLGNKKQIHVVNYNRSGSKVSTSLDSDAFPEALNNPSRWSLEKSFMLLASMPLARFAMLSLVACSMSRERPCTRR